MANRKKTTNSSLSSQNVSSSRKINDDDIVEIQKKVFDAVHNLELQKSLDKMLRQNIQEDQIVRRDFSILKDSISEYLDSFMVLGYTLDGERIVIQSFKTPKDKDAIVEFMKNIFLKQQNENFFGE
jgi:hypothetical protein